MGEVGGRTWSHLGPQRHQDPSKEVPEKIEKDGLEGFWGDLGLQNGAKIDIKGGWKNDVKMMMTRRALRSHMGESGWDCNLDFRAWGGGGRRGKPLLQGSWRRWD